jgi:peptidoglycan hydrolase-like protein with peptidoglycan-binding domain
MLRKLLPFILITISMAVGIVAQETTSTTSIATTSETTDAPKRAAGFRPNKDQIMQGQKVLRTLKLYDGDATGVYNEDTRDAISKYQKDHGLSVSRNFNRATLESMKIELTDKQKATPAPAESYVSASGDKTPKTKVNMSSAKSETDKSSGTAKSKRTIFKATADQVRAAQKLLKSKSMYDGEETGKLNDDTRDGLKKYQEANDIKVTGTLNAVTLEKMGIELTDKQKADRAAAAKSD